jgi:hypothetical protein
VPLHAKIVICIVVLISMTTTYLTVRQSMKRGMMPTNQAGPMGQSQKLMAYIMPLFALTGLYWQFGLVLYWVTTNLWTLGQQYVLLRKYPVGAAAAAADGNVPIGGKAGKPATASGLTSGTKPKPSGGTTGAKKTGTGAGSGSGRTASGRPTSLNKGSGVSDAKPSQAGRSSSAAKPSSPSKKSSTSAASETAGTTGTTGANGHKPASNDGGVLRRFTKGRSEPEPPPEPEPETKIVRQQRQRQSRSKRSGKR